MSSPTEVAATIPVANTGKARLKLTGTNAGGTFISVLIPIKGSIVIEPGKYDVVASGGVIANIFYAINDFKVTPTSYSEKEARFAVYVNLSEK